MSAPSHIIQLLRAYIADNSNTATIKELAGLCENEDQAEEVRLALSEIMEIESEARVPLDETRYDDLFRQIMSVDKPAPLVVSYRQSVRRWGWVAASILLMAAGAYFWYSGPVMKSVPVVVQDIAPGSNKATLTLADGSVITLDSAGNQVLQQGATAIRQTGGQLVYNVQGSNAIVNYNQLKTPRGGQFQVTLPDGTKVWLNAASSLRYPTAFNGRERKVEITGEAYFEVAKNADMPFRVKVEERAEVEVLGTHFNVNAYGNEESLNTTLIEGEVKVSVQAASAILKPGQQARITSGRNSISVARLPNPDKVIAWKNGAFDFENVTLEEAMRQLERWYNIDVVYENGIPDIRFGGKMSRDKRLSQLLRNLQDVGVRFRIEGRRLIITY